MSVMSCMYEYEYDLHPFVSFLVLIAKRTKLRIPGAREPMIQELLTRSYPSVARFNSQIVAARAPP